MVQITPVTLEYDPRPRWFDPHGVDVSQGDAVIVHTQRGLEYGYSEGIHSVEDEAVKALPTALQPVERVATDEDVEQHKRMIKKGKDAFSTFKELAAETNKDMHPIMVAYTFDGDRAIFFFEAEDRVDFRELVRRLASVFHVHVDMHQIGVRDEARMVGGIGLCGQELCCRRMGSKFHQVTIRMAKEQGLSLNPEKVSGLCGRLMCCLRYEYDAYHEFNARAPKFNATISTPEGPAKVVDINVPKELITVKLESDENNHRITFPLSAMDMPAEDEHRRPHVIGDVFEQYLHPDPYDDVISFGQFDTHEFTQDDKLGDAKVTYISTRDADSSQEASHISHRHNESSRRRRGRDERSGTRRIRRRHTSNNHVDQGRHDKENRAPRDMRPGRKSSSLSREAQTYIASHHRRNLHRSFTSGSAQAQQHANAERDLVKNATEHMHDTQRNASDHTTLHSGAHAEERMHQRRSRNRRHVQRKKSQPQKAASKKSRGGASQHPAHAQRNRKRRTHDRARTHEQHTKSMHRQNTDGK